MILRVWCAPSMRPPCLIRNVHKTCSRGHVPTARSVPSGELEARIDEVLRTLVGVRVRRVRRVDGWEQRGACADFSVAVYQPPMGAAHKHVPCAEPGDPAQAKAQQE